MKTRPSTGEPRLQNTYPFLNVASDPEASSIAAPRVADAAIVSAIPRVCLSRAEAAQALGIGLSTLKSLESQGRSPPAFDAPGGRKLYPVNLLIEWAADRARSGKPTHVDDRPVTGDRV
jgi:hypothetical protein